MSNVQEDRGFDRSLFEKQMNVMRGQVRKVFLTISTFILRRQQDLFVVFFLFVYFAIPSLLIFSSFSDS